MSTSANLQKKPTLLKVIFILNALLVIAGFSFYFIFSNQTDTLLGIPPITLLTMALIYAAMFAGIVLSISKKQIWALRVLLTITLVCSIVIIIAPIGIGISLISLGLSFTKPVLKSFG
ncbi:MAG: hypothetical protein ACI8ZM_003519 [Crocinitomix sp.]|jgi:hypothetical protein